MTIWDDCSNTAHWRNRSQDQPFFSVFNHTITHESKIRIPIEKEVTTDPAKINLPPYYPDTPVVRNDWARYYDNIATMDCQVGELLKQLDEDGLAETTVVFFYSDHGRGLPRAKRWIYDSGLQVPLMIRWPGQIEPGTVCNDLVSFVDFGPTVFSLAGVPIPSHMQGRAFLGKQASSPRTYIYAARDRMDEQYDFIRCVRDKKFKYIRNFMPEKPYALEIPYMDLMPTMQEMRRLNAEGKLKGAETLFFRETKPVHELYDITVDPHEINNLADNLEYKDELERLQKALHEWMDRINDMGDLPEKEMVDKMWPGGIQPETSKPDISPTGGSFKGSVTMHLSCSTEGASIAYTTDETENPHWLLYSKPVKLNKSCSVRAKAIRYGYQHSGESKADFEIER
jgi:N-sulfoglucosamine sulfohydrolase